MSVLFENEYSTIYLDDKKYIEYEFKKYVPSDEFKLILEKVFELSKQNSCKVILPNMKNMKVIPDDVQEWIKNDWFPRMIGIGVKTYVMVNPDSVIAKSTTANIDVKPDEYGITSVFVSGLQEAKDWISKNIN